MRSTDNSLFANGDLGTTLRNNHKSKIEPAVDRIEKDQLLATPVEDIVDHLYSELHVEPLVIYEDQLETSESEARIEVIDWTGRRFRNSRGPHYVPGHQIVLDIPYTGEHGLWNLRPGSCRSTFPHGDPTPAVYENPGNLRLTFYVPIDNLDEEKLKAEIESGLESVRFYVGASHNQVCNHNNEIRCAIKAYVEARKDRILKTEGLASRLGLTLKRKANAPSIEHIKMTRKLVRPLPPPPDRRYEPEPGIDETSYEHILGVIRHEIATVETTPETYQSLGEESLRNILLAHLNGHYEGDATGETFRHKGKTDIRIESEDRAAFVAECKLWKGSKEFSSAIDQLIGYLTWRDCKTALIVFNKEVSGFSKLLADAYAKLKEHPLLKREIQEIGQQNEKRFCFRSPHDELQEIFVHVFIANLYVSAKK